jgi:hypothetical protein
MAEKFLGCLRALIAVLFDRPLPVRVGFGRRAHTATLFPRQGIVLPTISGGADGDADADEGDADADEGNGDDDERDADSDGDEGEKKDADHYRRELRRYERTTKTKRERDKKELKETQDELKKLRDANKSEQDRAVEKAKEEGRDEALSEAQKERRADRLESAVIRAAGKRTKIGEGDDAKEVRWDDPEDAELYLQRAIKRGDVDVDDLFDDNGKVKTDVVEEHLKEFLEEKPRLAEAAGGGKDSKGKTAEGGADQGRGKGSDGKPNMNDLLRRNR